MNSSSSGEDPSGSMDTGSSSGGGEAEREGGREERVLDSEDLMLVDAEGRELELVDAETGKGEVREGGREGGKEGV